MQTDITALQVDKNWWRDFMAYLHGETVSRYCTETFFIVFFYISGYSKWFRI